MQSGDVGETTKVADVYAFWQSIWSLMVSGKVKNFLQRVSTNIIPTKFNLFKKQAVESGVCPLCLQEDEIVIHMVRNCRAAGDVQVDNSVMIHKQPKEMKSYFQLWCLLTSIMSLEELTFAAAIMRHIWIRQNDIVFNNKMKGPLQVIKAARIDLQEFSIAIELDAFRPPHHSTRFNFLDATSSWEGKA